MLKTIRATKDFRKIDLGVHSGSDGTRAIISRQHRMLEPTARKITKQKGAKNEYTPKTASYSLLLHVQRNFTCVMNHPEREDHEGRTATARSTYVLNRTDAEVYRWQAVADAHELQRAAISTLLASAEQAIYERGQFHIVLAGGNTPREIYRGLSTAKTEWSAWHIYFSDERCLPPLDAARNSRMAAAVWLNNVPIPALQLHVIAGELGANEAAQQYSVMLRTIGDFDLVLLGLGEDGHTASLFPGHDWGTAPGSADALAVFDAPKPPPQRVSLSAARLSRARRVIFLVSGESKRWAVEAWRAGKDIPARAIRPAAGVDVLVESALLSPLVVPK
jgi:6-phosphogluconolactonase